MLKVFRRKGVAKKVLWVIAIIIIISFGFGFGISRYSDGVKGTGVAGKIFGKPVSSQEFKTAYADTRDQAIFMHGANFEKTMPYVDMEGETWTRIMLVKEADRRGIKVADQDVIQFLAKVPFFQRDGVFDKQLYGTLLAQIFRRNPRDFEEGVRNQIKIMKIFAPLTAGVAVSDEEIRREYERRNRKVQARYVLIDPTSFSSGISIDDKEIRDYFDSHRAEFLVPDTINVQYITVPLKDKASNDEKLQAEAKAQEIYQKATQKNADFKDVAQAAGLKAEETGNFNAEEPYLSIGWSFELLQQVFAAKKEDILSPASTPAGIQILKVIDHTVAYIPDFEKAKDRVKAKLLETKTNALAKQKAETVHKDLESRLAEGKTFSVAVKELGLEAKETPFFLPGDYLPEIGISGEFQSAVMTLTKDQPLSNVISTAKGAVIACWKAAEPVDEEKFTSAKKDFAAALLKDKQAQALNAVVTEIRERAKLESYLEKDGRQTSNVRR